MLIEKDEILQSLKGICARFTADPALHDDLMQECLVHLWRIERERPNQTKSWYLQSCRFHVQHQLGAGRSLDTSARAGKDRAVPIDGDGEEPALREYHTNGDLFDGICFQDAVSTLQGRLMPREKVVLNGLAEGRTLTEIVFDSKLSYPTVLKYRRRIASLTTKLGIAPSARLT